MTRSRIQSLPAHALRAFEAASRLGSFKAAAAELSVTPAAISHQVKGLEAALGIPLFDRLHRSLRLTSAGGQLARAAQQSFRLLEGTLAALLEQGRLAGPTTLNLSASSSIAAKWLAPRLHHFQQLHPNVDLRLRADDRCIDLLREAGTDVALRYGPAPRQDGGLEIVPLWPPGRMVVVCAPAILDRGKLQTPADVLRFTLLRTGQPVLPGAGGTERSIDWKDWLAAAGIEKEVRGLHFGSTHLALEAAMVGEGLALAPEILVAQDLCSGRLAQPFTLSIANPCSYWLMCRSDRLDEAKIRLFFKWALKQAASSQMA